MRSSGASAAQRQHPVIVREATRKDADALTAIDAQCFCEGIAYPRTEIAALLRSGAVHTVVAETSLAILGFASFGYRLPTVQNSSPIRLEAELITIDVLPEFRRERVGSLLYQELESSFRKCNGKRIELHVSVENRAAINFYNQLGYSVVQRVPEYYLRKLDAWKMEKLL